MLTPDQFFGFLFAALIITATPGPDNLMVLSMGISKGRRNGVAFGLGCAMGCLSHTVLAVIGVSALIASSPAALTALKIVGGLYLVWLGRNAWRGAASIELRDVLDSKKSLSQLFCKGCFANAVNPKVVLFFLSFLPQFIDVGRGDEAQQMGLLGLTFTAQAAMLFGVLGWFSGSIGKWLNKHPRAGGWLDRIAGIVFIGLGLKLIFTR